MASIVTDLRQCADSHPDRPAVRAGDRILSYADLRDRIARAATRLAAAGVSRDDRVLLIAPSVPEFAIAYYGLQSVGATAITLNVMSTPAEIGYVIDDSGTSLVLAWHRCAEAARSAAGERGLPMLELTEFENEPDDAVAATAPVDRDADDTAVILYTSGTTGRPKGAQLTVANIDAVPAAFQAALQVGEHERWATALPLFHCFGQVVVMHNALAGGGTLSLLSPFTPTAFMDRLRDEHITIACGVPTMWNAMLQVTEGYTPADFADLRLACSGGASMPGEVIREFSDRFGCSILEGYGLTETAGTTTFRNLEGPPKVGTVGPALPGFTIEVRDPDGHPVPADEIGEIFIKGPTVMKGYWNRPDATAAELVDGWFRTGDLGTMDTDGDVRIVDRTKDMIIRGGYNVYPREVEEVLYTHPDIVEVAVIGVADDHYGEEIAAVITPRPGTQIDPDALRAWTKERLSAYKVPRIIRFVDALPKGATGKILKRAIDRSELVAPTSAATGRSGGGL
ncbi:AMP-binding protein [Gordonia sp. NB41Y]|uniref:class I adenylate-forming enzyme family protein n=1 Tax=Gordonia sp. NB41Y TaxID=875808 RepID=UPI00273C5A3A|nr:AMP-binding protein [Gordonia sp. NB41Y]WLP91658.1 AMP-binding protein [Gordonia sp. NB41Y]